MLRGCVAAVAWGLPLVLLLAANVPGELRQALGAERLEKTLHAVEIPPLRYLTGPGLPTVHRVRLQTSAPQLIATHQAIELLVSTYDTFPRLASGELLLDGTDCVYRTAQGAALRNNAYLAFERGAACAPLRGAPSGIMSVTFTLDNEGRVALWAGPQRSDRPQENLYFADRTVSSSRESAVLGVLVDRYPETRATRASLIWYVWQLPWPNAWVWGVVIVSAASIGAAVLLWPGTRSAGRMTGGQIARLTGAAFLAAGSIGSTYALVTPPFQAPDEPHHFTGFTWFAGRKDIDYESATWARAIHFQRIQFRPDQHFTPTDRGTLGPPWPGGAPPYEERGTAVEWLWRALAPVLRALSAPKMLLALRLVDVAMFAASVALAVAVLAVCARATWPELLALPFFLVPTLPFFGMAVSNYALLTDAYLLFAVAVLLHCRERTVDAAGPLMGVSWAAAMLLSRSAVPLAPIVAALALTRLILGPAIPLSAPRRALDAAVYWFGLTVPLSAATALAGSNYLSPLARDVGVGVGSSVARLVALVSNHPWLLTLIPLATIPIEVANGSTRRGRHDAASPAIRLGALAGAALVIVSMALSAFLAFPGVDAGRTAPSPEARRYTTSLLLAFATSARLRHPDFFTSTSFWGGFGWLETVPPEAFVTTLACASGLATVGYLILIARSASVRLATTFAAVVIGCAASLVLYGVSIARITPTDVVGRYLLGLQLGLLAVTWSSVSWVVETRGIRSGARAVGAAAAACGAAHLFCLGVILRRYF